jgi:hypothetical protein
MKTIIRVMFILLFGLSSYSYSQVRAYGLKLGAVAANQTWDYSIYHHLPTINRWGVDVGVYMEWLNMAILSLSTELHFAERGMREQLVESTPAYPEGTGRRMTFDNELDYLSLPILVKARYELEPLEAYILAGPRIDVKLSSRQSWNTVYDRFRDVSYGATLGVGLSFQNIITGKDFGVEYRFSPSFGSEYSIPGLEVTGKSMEFFITLEL